MNSKKVIIILIACLLICFSAAFTVFSFVKEINRPRLPELGKTIAFELINSRGEKFSSDFLKGRVWIVDFFFTTCGDICPVMSENMAALNRSFEQLPGVHLVSVTVHPEFDSPEILSNYQNKFEKIDKSKWHLLTGERAEITKLAIEGFKLGSIEEPVFHSPHFALVDRNGYIRGYYDGTDTERVNILFKDAIRLLKER